MRPKFVDQICKRKNIEGSSNKAQNDAPYH